MPYQWLPPDGTTQRLHLWPHRSLSQRGFVVFIIATAVLITAPMLRVLGQTAAWVLLPFLLIPLAAVWFALRKNGRDRDLIEELTLTPTQVHLTRHAPRQPPRHWQANPHWVRVSLHEKDGPVPAYVILQGGPREVELGAFLSEDERRALVPDLSRRLAGLR